MGGGRAAASPVTTMQPAAQLRRAGRLALAVLLAVPGALAAHPFFVQPTDFHPGTGDLIGFELWVGHPPGSQPMPRSGSHLERFSVTDASGTRPVAGVEGIHPAGYLRPSAPGALVVLYASRPVAHQMTMPAFLAYLEEEGQRLPPEGLRRAASSREPVRESYVRCAKAILAVGGELGPVAERALGCTLELVPELRSGKLAGARLLLRGRPLSGVQVLAMPIASRHSHGPAAQRPLAPLTPPPEGDRVLRTDQDGRVALPDLDGPIVLHAVYGEPPRGASASENEVEIEGWIETAAPIEPAGEAAKHRGSAAGDARLDPGPLDWQSFWASLVLPPSAPPAERDGTRGR
jgi:hypothetical protein